MTTKEKIIRAAIADAKRQIEEIDALIEARPISNIIEIREDFKALLEQNQGVEKRTRPEFLEAVEELSRREKEQFRIAEMMKNSTNLIEKKVKLDFELRDLNNELYFLTR
ncbi:MAG: hypothetical protein IPJ02_17500 [Chitinophagaceae bacterium]|nr:hypothetical protein [Chitinophagaceae bacterium]